MSEPINIDGLHKFNTQLQLDGLALRERITELEAENERQRQEISRVLQASNCHMDRIEELTEALRAWQYWDSAAWRDTHLSLITLRKARILTEEALK